MADDSDTVGVNIVADASGMQAGADEVVEAIGEVGESTTTLQAEFAELEAQVAETFAAMREGAVETAEAMKGIAEGVIAIEESISGIGEAFLAAFAVEAITEFAEKMGETAEKNVHLAEMFGTTTAAIQRLNGEAAFFGVSADAITTAMGRATRSLTTAREGATNTATAWRAVGVNIHDSITPVQAFNEAVSGLSKIPDQTTKLGLAYQLFGRNIKDIAPLIGATQEQLDEFSEAQKTYGIVDDEATAKGLQLAESFNQNKLAMMGLGNVMTDALAPALTTIVTEIDKLVGQFIQSYKEGGTAKTVMDVLAISLRVVASTVDLLLRAWVALVLVGAAVVDQLKAVAEAATGQFDAAIKSEKKSMDDLTKSVMQSYNAYRDLESLWGQTPAALPKTENDGAGNGAGLAKAKKAKDDKVAVWQEGLDEQLMAQNNFFADSTAFELAYWQNILATETMSAKDRLEIEKKVYEDKKKLAEQAKAEALTEIKNQQALDQEADREATSNLADQLAAQKEALAQRVALHQISAGQELQAELDLSSKTVEYAARAAQDDYEVQLTALQAKLNLGTLTVAETAEVNAQILLLNTDLQNKLTDLERKGALDRKKIEDQAALQAAQRAHQFIDPIVQAWGTGMTGMIEGTTSFQQAFLKIGESILDQFVAIIERMVERWIVSEALKVAATRVSQIQIVGLHDEAAAQTSSIDFLSTIKQVTNAAVKAATAAYSAMAGIPIIGPELGAVAAAVTFAAVEGFGALASAEGGYDIPAGINPLVQTHAEEMILPARLANPLREVLSGATAPGQTGPNAGQGAGQGGGDTHNHWHISAMDSKDVTRFAKKNGAAFLAGTNKGTRNNGRLGNGS